MRRARSRHVGTIALALLLALTVGGSASAALGPKIHVHPHTGSRSYDNPNHHFAGHVVIANKSNKRVKIRCQVVILLKGPGTTHKRGFAMVHADIRKGHTKSPNYAIKIKDANHKFNNIESNTAAHCHKVSNSGGAS